MATKKHSWGFSVGDLDQSVRPQDDYFSHVNKSWIAKNPIPKTEARWGTFMELRVKTETQVRTIIESLQSKKNLSDTERMVRDFYCSGMDIERRNKEGLRPLAELLAAIDAIRTQAELQKVLAVLHRTGLRELWVADVDQDAKNVDVYAFYIMQGGLGMPDREYYINDTAESVRVRTAYSSHVTNLLRLMGSDRTEAARLTETILSIETKLAHASMSKEDRRDPHKVYNKYTIAQLEKWAPTISWKQYLQRVGGGKASYVIVMQPNFIKEVSSLLATVSIEEWKTYLSFHVVNSLAYALSEPFIKENFAFYQKVLTGTTTIKPLWRRVLAATEGGVGEALGKLYVEKHFPPEAKKKMELLVADLFTAYKARLSTLSWMSPKTRKKALEKLASFSRKIGYPQKWKSYTGLKVSPKDFVGNILRAAAFEQARSMRRIEKPIDRSIWLMTPQTVNAYYQPTMNEIVFPAAILQPPYFGLTSDDAINYGAIGMVIGHEITHGFDDEGSQFDAKGNLKNWWTLEDRKLFEERAKKIETQYSSYDAVDGLKVNGKLTLGENIADLGGLSIAYDAYQLHLARTGRIDIDGLSPEERFFIGFAAAWREHERPEYLKMRVLNDPHSPDVYRVRGPLSNFEPFYERYGVRKGDGMYRDPKDREVVW